MPYPFNFDLSSISRQLFRDIARITYNSGVHRRIGDAARLLLKKFRIQELTGLDFSEAIQLIEDLIEIQIENVRYRERFLNARRRALFLPHCSRKYMDSNCKARFNPDVPSYYCSHCSDDCLINQATRLGEKMGYDVYILPGGSCIKRILQTRRYEAVVGVACGMEIRLAKRLLEKMGLPGQAVPLIKNGCANTIFSMETLKKVLTTPKTLKAYTQH